MCRISGIYNFSDAKVDADTLISMRESLRHGGPDDSGIFVDHNVGFAHRRLSIIDLSENGRQPMSFGDWTMVYNGEVYNYKEIREKLSPDYQFHSSSDSEVILKAFDKWGMNALSHFNGMFAIALWNKKSESLYLIRDRLGIKPLYWYKKDDLFLFASELKAFHKHPHFDKSISPTAVSLYLQYSYIPSPNCIFKYAHKLQAGSFLQIKSSKEVVIKKWWSFNSDIKPTKEVKTEKIYLEELEEKLGDAIEKRLIADVPVGMFLSGGTDSTLLSAIATKRLEKPLQTFTFGIKDSMLDESEDAKKIASHLGIKQKTVLYKSQDFLSIVDLLPEIYDEPFGDSSSIPTFLVSQMAKNDVTVCLSGDGGDELFGGYTKYLATTSFFPKLKYFPSKLLQPLSSLSENLLSIISENYLSSFPFLSDYSTNLSAKFSKLNRSISAVDEYDFFMKSSKYLSNKQLSFLHSEQSKTGFNTLDNSFSLLSKLGIQDLMTFTEGDILTKVDRASMANALEIRTPFLDHDLFQFAFSLPDHLKISKKRETKYLSKKLLEKYLPNELIYKNKKGFEIPILSWLKEFYSEDLVKIKNDTEFHEIFNLKTDGIKDLINRFTHKKHIPESFVVWYLFCLYRWHLRWIQ